MQINLEIGKLAEYIEEYTKTALKNDQELLTKNFGIAVPTIDGSSEVNFLVKKFNLPALNLEFNNGYKIQVAQKHIFQSNKKDIFASNLMIGSQIDHFDGVVYVTKIDKIESLDCFDLAIDSPHLYYDANGLVHHNTIVTAALSKQCENYGRTIVIVPSKSLVTQTEADYITMGLDVGVLFGDRKEYTKQHTICTWQSLNALLKNTKNYEADVTIHDFIENVICVIVDECFDGSTLVTTPYGKTFIKDIVAGDKIINFCEKTKSYKEDTVVEVHRNLTHSRSEKMLELTFDNGQIIKVTANHKFLTSVGWVRADELTNDMEVININTFS